MSTDVFQPPESDDTLENFVLARARKNLFAAAASALGLGLLQWCCNPFFIVSILAAGAASNAIRQPKWMKISL